MRRTLRLLGTLMIAGGVLALAWTVLVWRWQDPFTALYTHVQQSRLSARLDHELRTYPSATVKAGSLASARRAVAAEAAAYRRTLHPGDPLGRITVGRIGLRIVVVQGTDHESLKKGPGHYPGSYLPGQGHLIYVAGHRTTYLAPFSHIDAIRAGDYVTLELPYGTFKYVVTGHRVVPSTDVSVLRPGHRELLILQACHPRFFATHRYLVYARPVSMALRGGPSFTLGGARLAAGARAAAS
ncbi:MAG TPA: class D sortase [Gaiellaceae bacterium]